RERRGARRYRRRRPRLTARRRSRGSAAGLTPRQLAARSRERRRRDGGDAGPRRPRPTCVVATPYPRQPHAPPSAPPTRATRARGHRTRSPFERAAYSAPAVTPQKEAAMRGLIGTILVLMHAPCLPSPTHEQTTLTPAPSPTDTDSRWEVSVEGRVGFPVGYIRVNETATHGTHLRLSDLGLDVSEAIEAGIAFWLTPRDAVRATYLYYFLRGGKTFDRAIVYDGQEYAAG